MLIQVAMRLHPVFSMHSFLVSQPADVFLDPCLSAVSVFLFGWRLALRCFGHSLRDLTFALEHQYHLFFTGVSFFDLFQCTLCRSQRVHAREGPSSAHTIEIRIIKSLLVKPFAGRKGKLVDSRGSTTCLRHTGLDPHFWSHTTTRTHGFHTHARTTDAIKTPSLLFIPRPYVLANYRQRDENWCCARRNVCVTYALLLLGNDKYGSGSPC